MTQDSFKVTRRFTVTVLISIFILSVISIIVMASDAVPVLSVAIPSMAGLTSVYTGITNKWGKQNDKP